MIVFDLRCASGHVFEGWFGDSGEYERQRQADLLSCPLCGETRVTKAVMAPNVAAKSNRALSGLADDGYQPAAVAAAPAPPEVRLIETMLRIRQIVEDRFEHVGERFAEEARAIHMGEAPARGVYGEATAAEVAALEEEGIAVAPLPFPARGRLNS